MSTDRSGCPLIPTAIISVENVQLNGSGVCNKADFRLANNVSGLVYINGSGLKSEIFIKGRIQLQFEFGGDFVPIGISFTEEPPPHAKRGETICDSERDLQDPLGLETFPERKILSVNGTTLMIMQVMHPSTTEEACFDFSLVIQKSGVKKPIVIDPKIRIVPM